MGGRGRAQPEEMRRLNIRYGGSRAERAQLLLESGIRRARREGRSLGAAESRTAIIREAGETINRVIGRMR